VTPPPATATADTSHDGWWRIALGGGGGMFVGMGLGRFSYTAMVPALVEAGGMTAVEAGRVGMVNLIGFMLGAALSAMLLRVGAARRILTVAILLSGTALAASALPYGAVWLAACRGVVGVTTGITMVLSLALIAATAPERKRPVAASFMFAGVGLGVLMSGTLVPLLVAQGLFVTWSGLALAGLIGVVLAIWGWQAAPDLRPPSSTTRKTPVAWRPLAGLLVAHALFSLGIVPHTLYWVDYIARGLGQGITVGGLHWSLVGVFSVLGPWMAARTALRMGAAWGLVAGFAALGLGIGGPALWPATGMLVLSSALFGAQPGMSVLMAVRARELGASDAMPRVMRAMILANSCGAVIGGLTVPALYGLTGSHGAVFLLGGAAMLVGAMAAWPSQQRG
jgi:predicted MFS family arabinose efflux permease